MSHLNKKALYYAFNLPFQMMGSTINQLMFESGTISVKAKGNKVTLNSLFFIKYLPWHADVKI